LPGNLQSAIYNPGGPEGIRTPDLLSAIEARSQLRYRPDYRANGILTDAGVDVKKGLGVFTKQPGNCMLFNGIRIGVADSAVI
jgi:hypothetical protein